MQEDHINIIPFDCEVEEDFITEDIIDSKCCPECGSSFQFSICEDCGYEDEYAFIDVEDENVDV